MKTIYNCSTLQITQFTWDSFFFLLNMHSATLSFVYKNITWRFLLTVFYITDSIFFLFSLILHYFPPSERVTACSNHYNSFSTTCSSPYNSIPNYTMCKIHTQQNVWIFSALLQTNLTSLVFLNTKYIMLKNFSRLLQY